MMLKEIISFLDEKIPTSLALDFDEVGLKKEYDLTQDITSVKIYMDILAEDDDYENTLIITHHPPIFTPKTPTYTIHSNWDIIDGGACDALADTLNLEITDYLDDDTHIGRICTPNQKFSELKENILNNFTNVRIVNDLDDEKQVKKVGVISGFGLGSPDYVNLSYDRNLDILISGDLCQKTAILAKNLGITLIDLNHHESEIPGLYALAEIIKELDIDVEIIDKKPIEQLVI